MRSRMKRWKNFVGHSLQQARSHDLRFGAKYIFKAGNIFDSLYVLNKFFFSLMNWLSRRSIALMQAFFFWIAFFA